MKRKRLIWGVVAVVALGALVGYDLLKTPGQSEQVEIVEEFELQPLIKLPAIGPFDLSVNKAVVYLWITAAVLIVFALLVRRSLRQEPPLALIHISEPTRLLSISYAVFCWKKKKQKTAK